jgi:sorbitol/mannitol transport system substrate-binding protein
MHRFRFMLAFGLISSIATLAGGETQLTIATVNNADMIIMQKLSKEFEKQHPDIKLDWVILEENVLRERTTTDIATKGGQFDVLTIGTYETPIWGKRGWLLRQDEGLPASYDLEDLLEPIREGLSYEGKLYALPFYGESSFTYYRKDLFDKAGLRMPDRPRYEDIARFAQVLNDPAGGVYGITLRGKPGWGENMAYVSTLVNTYGGRWFDENWKPEINSPEWKQAVTFYVDLLKTFGPPGSSSNGHNECRALFANGQAAMWIDTTSAAGYLVDPKQSKVADKVAFAPAPIAKTATGQQWLWSWALAVPVSSTHPNEARQFIQWATSKEYIKLVARTYGWIAVPPGTRKSTYEQTEYRKAAPFAKFVLQAMQDADLKHPTAKPVPYTGIQFVAIPEFSAIGTEVGQQISAALVGRTTVDKALDAAQSATESIMRRTRPSRAQYQYLRFFGTVAAAAAVLIVAAGLYLIKRLKLVGRRAVNTFSLQAPSIILLLLWSIVPLSMSLWFSLQHYNLLNPQETAFVGLENYRNLLTDPALLTALRNTLVLVGSVLVITVVFGTLLAVLLDQDFFGRWAARLFVISPLFVMPTVAALLWKNMMMHPVNGVISHAMHGLGQQSIDWFGQWPLTAIVIIVAWQWLPYSVLILLTAIQSLDPERKEAARMDGAGPVSMFFYIIVPHLGRAISVVVMVETLFLLSVFAEVFVTTSGGPGLASTNLAFLIYKYAMLEHDIGAASAAGVLAIILANFVAIFLVRSIARNIHQA